MVDSEYPTENRLWQMAKRGMGVPPMSSSIGPADGENEETHGQDAHATNAHATSCPDAMDMSAWLDGRADDRAAGLIDSHLASCRACLDAAIELRVVSHAVGRALPDMPRAVLDHAKALVPATRQARPNTQRTNVPACAAVAATAWRRPSRLAFPQWAIGAARWAAAAMLILAVAYGGFSAGLKTSRYYDEQAVARVNDNDARIAAHVKETIKLAKEGPFGLGQADATDQDELLALAEAD